MKSTLFASATRQLALALMVGSAAPSFAIPVADMRIEDLLPLAAGLKESLNLSANQQTLWQHVESRSRAIVRERQERRERLQQAARQALDKPQVELRELAPALEAETAASSAEENELRRLWLDVNDALDDPQRKAVAALLAEQLMRAPDSGAPGRGEGRGRNQEPGMRGHEEPGLRGHGAGRHPGGS